MGSGSKTPDPRHVSRRDSSPRNGGRRPRLLRASATEPSITTSNASRNALCNSQSSRRALDMLSRVAVISGSPPDSVIRCSTPISTPPMSPMSAMYDRQEGLSSSPVNHTELEKIRPHHCTQAEGTTASPASTSMRPASKTKRRRQRSLPEVAELADDNHHPGSNSRAEPTATEAKGRPFFERLHSLPGETKSITQQIAISHRSSPASPPRSFSKLHAGTGGISVLFGPDRLMIIP
ncbi:hypothetical protein GE09DRAFT_1112173 [Coniochaeta sp. 2T2.1]|nr:hypothetical protein GE09DRAFT_1112173 [Coniochaeta sp. 2T2.1]